jgi:hypothetical protein
MFGKSKSLVIELQRLADDAATPIATVLRKALIVATKLGIDDFREWAEAELHGYQGSSVPDYRVIRGSAMALNPVRGKWMPIFVEDSETAGALRRVELRETISEIESFTKEPKGRLLVDCSPETTAYLNAHSGLPIPMRCSIIIERNNLVGVLDKVRTTLLQWSLKLESTGILGEGFRFSEIELKKAEGAPALHITNYVVSAGVFIRGNMNNGTVSGNSSGRV